MARKRANNKKAEVKPISKAPIVPLDGRIIQELNYLVEASKTYVKMSQQLQQYEFAVSTLEANRKRAQKGELTKINVPVAPQCTEELTDKKVILKYLDDQIKTMKNSTLGIRGSLQNKTDVYVEAGLRITKLFENIYKGHEIQKLSGTRGKTGKASNDEERKLFEASFDEINKSPKVKAEFEKAKAKAIKLNKQEAKK